MSEVFNNKPNLKQLEVLDGIAVLYPLLLLVLVTRMTLLALQTVSKQLVENGRLSPIWTFGESAQWAMGNGQWATIIETLPMRRWQCFENGGVYFETVNSVAHSEFMWILQQRTDFAQIGRHDLPDALTWKKMHSNCSTFP